MHTTSEKTDIIDAALLEVQRALKLIGKDGNAKSDRQGTEIKLRFASAELIYETCHDLLVENGIMLWQGGERDQGTERLLTVLAKGGQQRVSSFPIIAREGAQNFGGGLGFAKRWGLQAAVGIYTTDKLAGPVRDGYDPKPARRSAAPAGVGDAIAAITEATSTRAFEDAVARGRGAFPRGEEGNAVEKAASAWMVHALETVKGPDEGARLVTLRDSHGRVKTRSTEVRDAIADAERRVKGGGA